MGRVALFVLLGAFLMSACGEESTAASSGGATDTVPTAAAPDASIVVLVDCGADGVANVKVEYGTGPDQTVLIGRNPTTLGAGGSETFSGNYGTAAGFSDANLTVTTSPTRGTCKTSLTDYNSGEVLGERETAGRVTLKAVVPGDS